MYSPVFKNVAIWKKNEMCAPFVFSSNGVSLWWENKRHIYIFHVHFPLQRFWKGVCIYIYHINYGVIQGFPALRKAVTTQVKKTHFFTCVWYRQSAADTSLAFRAIRSGWWMNGKTFTILDPRSFVRIFSDNGCYSTKKSVSLTDSDVQTFFRRGRKPKYEKKNRKLRTQWLW